MISSDSRGAFSLTVPAPLGFPPVFYKSDSVYGQQLRSFVVEQNYTYGYSWSYDESTSDHKTWWQRQTLVVRILLVVGASLFLLVVLYTIPSVFCGKKQPSALDDVEAHGALLPSAPPSEHQEALLSVNHRTD